jgi:hypothetical protein
MPLNIPRFLILIFFCTNMLQNTSYGQSPDTIQSKPNSRNNKRAILAGSANLLAFAGTLGTLNQIWYSDHPRSSFHFHDDLKDWKQMDKLGHVTSTYHFSKLSYRSFQWAGLSNSQSTLWGSLSGMMLISTIEILDGFSAEWGFSWSDMGANVIGSGSFLAQQIFWEDQKITWKYAYSQTGIEKYRPDLLGNNFGENLVKDYNGHTFWLSANLNSLVNLPDGFPRWLNLAIGHGASGMLGSLENPKYFNGNPLPEFQRTRHWYIAPDVDLSRIETGSHFVNQVLTTLNFLKFPAPALEYNTQGKWIWHWVFF